MSFKGSLSGVIDLNVCGFDGILASAKMLPPRVDLKHKRKAKKGFGKNAPVPKYLKPRPIQGGDFNDEVLNEGLLRSAFSFDTAVENYLGNLEFGSLVKNGSEFKDTIEDDKPYTLVLRAKDWLFTQVTAVSSVLIDPETGYRIDPETSKFVNDNGHAFPTDLILKYYDTFIGAYNFKNHEDQGTNYGVVIDAILRPMIVNRRLGKKIYYVDLLIATNRALYPEWCDQIESGRVRYVSMGANASSFICSKCGHKTFQYDLCEHLKYQKNKYFFEDGVKYIVGQIVDDSVNAFEEAFFKFEEISYLTTDPAFKGATKSYNYPIPENGLVEFTIAGKYFKKPAFQMFLDFIEVKNG